MEFTRVSILREDYPARSTAERIRGFLKFIFPLFVAAEPLFHDIEHLTARFRVTTEVGKVQFVKHYGSASDQLFAFEISIHICGKIFFLDHRCESLLDRVERLNRPAIIVLPVRTDQFFREPFEFCRIEGQWTRLMLTAKCARRRCISDYTLACTNQFTGRGH